MKTLLLISICVAFTSSLAAPQTIVLQPGTAIRIKIDNGSFIREYYKVDANGVLDIEAVGKVSVLGLTLDQATALVAQRYSNAKHISSSETTVSIKVLDLSVSVVGMVNNPNTLPFSDGLTVMKALSAAGGLQGSIEQRRVLLIREPKKMLVNVGVILKDPTSDIILHPGDRLEAQ